MDAGAGRSQVHQALVGGKQHFDSEVEWGLGHLSAQQRIQAAPSRCFGLAGGCCSWDSGRSAEKQAAQASVCCTGLVAGRRRKQAVKSAEAPLGPTAALFAVLVLLLSFSSPDLL